MVWNFEGRLVEGEANGIVKLEKDQNQYKGRMKKGIRDGNSVVREEGKEYDVQYENGIERKRERTFQGVRMMIIGYFFFFFTQKQNLFHLKTKAMKMWEKLVLNEELFHFQKITKKLTKKF